MNELLDNLLTMLQTSFTTTFTKYMKGKLELVAKDDLPICSVYAVETRQVRSGTVRDAAEYDVAVELMVNLRDYLDHGKEPDVDKIDTIEALIDLVEERETDGDAKAATVFGTINADLTALDWVLYTDDIRARYEQYLDSKRTLVGKVTVTFTAYCRPNRT